MSEAIGVTGESASGSGIPGATHEGETAAVTHGVPASLLVGAIALLVILVSVPRFRAHVLDANREDARVALWVLGSRVFPEPNEAPAAWPEGLMALVDGDDALSHRFPDARPAPDTGQLLHHGYRIDTGYLVEGFLRHPALVAWPNRYGRSGDVAYVLTADGRLHGHPNGGLWSAGTAGLMDADLSDEGWVLLFDREADADAR